MSQDQCFQKALPHTPYKKTKKKKNLCQNKLFGDVGVDVLLVHLRKDSSKIELNYTGKPDLLGKILGACK